MKKPDYFNKNKWLVDELSEDLVQIHGIQRVLHAETTRFQHAQIVETQTFGICLVLDGKIQSGARDEFIYHESLVHPAMLAHPNPRSVFIAGGGEGATLRDVLSDLETSYPGITKNVLSDDGGLHRFINVYVNDEDVRFLQEKETPLKESDEVSIVPAIAGG